VVLKDLFTKDIISSYINQLWRLLSGVVTLILIPLFVTPEVQGFWYTFQSISALSVFADLGFTTIILQFSAHEYAFLHMDSSLKLEGPQEYLERISSLFRFVIKWTAGLVLVAFPIIFAVGYYLFIQKASSSQWLVPWILYCIGAAIGFVDSILASFIQGCDQVSKIQRYYFLTAIVNTIVLFSSLFLHLGLLSIALAILISNLFNLVLITVKYRNLIGTLLRTKGGSTNWKTEVFGLLWKYALSWASGYFIFQIYTPLMFQFHGPVEAGKVGISMSMVTAMFNLSSIWLNANNPKLNMMVSKRAWKELDREFKKDMYLSLGTYIVGVLCLILLVLGLSGRVRMFDKIVARFLGPLPISMLIVGWFLQIPIGGMALYLRAHKQEPYVLPSITNGVFVAIVTILCSKYLSSDLFFLGFLMSFFFELPWTYAIFKRARQTWHLN